MAKTPGLGKPLRKSMLRGGNLDEEHRVDRGGVEAVLLLAELAVDQDGSLLGEDGPQDVGQERGVSW